MQVTVESYTHYYYMLLLSVYFILWRSLSYEENLMCSHNFISRSSIGQSRLLNLKLPLVGRKIVLDDKLIPKISLSSISRNNKNKNDDKRRRKENEDDQEFSVFKFRLFDDESISNIISNRYLFVPLTCFFHRPGVCSLAPL